MISYQEKNRWKRIAYSKIILLLLLVLLIWLLCSSYGIYEKQQKSQDNLERTKKELAILEKRQQDLQGKIERLNQGTGVEEEIRDKFRMVKEGEKMIVLVDSSDENNNVTTTPNKNWWETVRGWFAD